MFTEPDLTRQKQKKEDTFFDYKAILPKEPDVSVSPEPSSTRKTDDIIKNIFSSRPPAPTYDKNRPEELQRLAKISAIGKGINLLGDVISLGAGGNVRQRPQDNQELAYLQSMYDYIDKYNQRQDEWNWRDFTAKLKAGELALSQANMEEERKLRERMFESQEKWKELGFVSEQAWREFQAEKAQETQDLARDKFEADTAYKEMTAAERERHNEQMELSSMLRAQAQAIRAQKPSASTKTYTLYDSKGNPVELDENEREKVMALILEDPLTKLTQDEIDLLKPKLGQPFSTNTMNNIVQKYWEKIPSSRDYIYSKYGKPGQSGQETESKFDWGEFNRPEYKGPVRHDPLDF
jgi:hypothetical protein